MLFPRASASRGKKKLIIAPLYFYLYEIKKCASDFQNLIQTGDINFFVLHGVYFARYVPLKSSFSDEKTLVVESETHFSREAIEN